MIFTVNSALRRWIGSWKNLNNRKLGHKIQEKLALSRFSGFFPESSHEDNVPT